MRDPADLSCTSHVPLHAGFRRIDVHFKCSITCQITCHAPHMFHYMRDSADLTCTSHVPFHAGFRRIDVHFTCSITCGIPQTLRVAHVFHYMRDSADLMCPTTSGIIQTSMHSACQAPSLRNPACNGTRELHIRSAESGM